MLQIRTVQPALSGCGPQPQSFRLFGINLWYSPVRPPIQPKITVVVLCQKRVGTPFIDKYGIMVKLSLGYNRGLSVLCNAVCQAVGYSSWPDVLRRAKGEDES